MLKNILKRTLATVIVMVMVLTTFCFTDMGLFASANLSKSSPSRTLYFYVPETIYLEPVDGNMDTFQYYADRANSDNGAITNDVRSSTTGNVYFHCAGATSVSIKYDTAVAKDIRYGGSAGSSTGGTEWSTSTGVTGTDSVSVAISYGKLVTALTTSTTGAHTMLTWTATYTIDGVQYVTKNYSVVYAPLTGKNASVADTGAVRNDALCAVVETAWITGIHGIEANTDSTYRPASRSSYDALGGMVYQPLTDTTTWKLGSRPDTKGTNYFVPAANYDTSAVGWSFWWASWKNSNDETCDTLGYYNGIINIDTSRYTYYAYLPYLKCGGDLHWYGSHNHSGPSNSNPECHEYLGITALESASTTLNTTNLRNAKFDTKGGGCSIHGGDGSRKWDDKVPSSIQVLSTHKYLCMYVNIQCSYYDGAHWRNWYYAQSISKAYCRVAQVDKSTLRSEYNAEIANCRNSAWYNSTDWTTYEARMKAAAEALGDPENTTVTRSSSPTSLVDYAVAKATRLTGTASATHKKTTDSSQLGTDSNVSYNYGDTVTVTANSYTGYHFDHVEYTLNSSATTSSSSTTAVKNVAQSSLGFTVWYAPNTYTVQYVGNGNTGSDTTAASSHTYNTSSSLRSNGFKRTNTVTFKETDGTTDAATAMSATYTFNKWTTQGFNLPTQVDEDRIGKGASDKWCVDVPPPFAAGDVFVLEYDAKVEAGMFSNFFYGDDGYMQVASWTRWSSNAHGSDTVSGRTDGHNEIYYSHTDPRYDNGGVWTHYRTEFTLSATGGGENVIKKVLFRWQAGCKASVKNVTLSKKSGTGVLSNNASVSTLTSTNNGTVTLYADWTAPDAITLPKPTKSGYSLVAWYKDAALTHIAAYGTETLLPVSNVTLYAKWAPQPVINRQTVVQKADNTGYYAYANVSDFKGTPMEVKFPTWTRRNDQDDIIWGTGTEGSWTVDNQTYNYRYEVNISDHNNEVGTYYTHAYAYNTEGGVSDGYACPDFNFHFNLTLSATHGTLTSSPPAGSIVYAHSANEADVDPTRTTVTLTATPADGYQFSSWATSGTSITISNNQFTMPFGDVSVTANFTTIPYTIYFDEKGGTEIEDLPYNIESTGKLPAVSGKTGYTFAGWKPHATAGNWYTSTTYAGGTNGHSLTGMYGNVTLVAQWTKSTRNILYNINDGTHTNPNLAIFSQNTTTNGGVTYTFIDRADTDYGTVETFKLDGATSGKASTGALSNMPITVDAGRYAIKIKLESGTVTCQEHTGLVLEFYDTLGRQLNSNKDANDNDIARSKFDFSGNLSTYIDISQTQAELIKYLRLWIWDDGTTGYTDKKATLSNAVFSVNLVKIPSTSTTKPDTTNYALTSRMLEVGSGKKYTSAVLPTLTRTGYTFNGWFTAASGGTQVTTNTNTGTNTDDVTLYAHWTENKYSISYVLGDGGSIASTAPTTNISYTAKLTIPHPTRDGYTFTGWTATGLNTSTAKTCDTSGGTYDAWDGTSTTNQYFQYLNSTSGGSVTMTANWQANTYTINYNYGNTTLKTVTYTFGTSTDANSTIGGDKAVTSSGFDSGAPSGYTFSYYMSANDKFGKDADGSTVFKWTAGTNGTKADTIYLNKKQTSPITVYAVFSKQAKYYTLKNAAGALSRADATTAAANTANALYVNSGNYLAVMPAGPAVTSINQGTGWAFKYWTTAATADEQATAAQYKNGTRDFTGTTEKTSFYALYKRTATLYSGVNGSKNVQPDQRINPGSSTIAYQITGPGKTKTADYSVPAASVGWALAGWRANVKASTEAASGEYYVAAGTGNTTTITGSAYTYTAVFTRDLQINYQGNKADEIANTTAASTLTQLYCSGTTSTNGILGGNSITTKACGFTKIGYHFVKWASSVDDETTVSSGATEVTEGNAYTGIGATHGAASSGYLYAVWEKDTYSITYDLDGGENAAGNPTSYVYDPDSSVAVNDPKKTGYTFTGWTKQYVNMTWTAGFPNMSSGVIQTGPENGYPNAFYSNPIYLEKSVKYSISGGFDKSNVRFRQYNADGSFIGTTGNGNDFTPGKKEYVKVLYIVSADNTVKRDTVVTATEKKYKAADTPIPAGSTGNLKFIANWDVNKYTVTYDYAHNGGKSSGGADTTQTQNVEYGSSVTLPTAYSRDGWTLVGWTTSSSTSEKEPLTSYTMPDNAVTLYAIYSCQPSIDFIWLDANSVQQTTPVSATKIYNNATSTSLTSPATSVYASSVTKNDLSYTANNKWSTTPAYANTGTAPGATITLSDTDLKNGKVRTYYMNYDKAVTVKFYKNNGTWSSGSDPHTKNDQTAKLTAYGSTGTATAAQYTTYSDSDIQRTGYTLLGWDVSSTATAAAYAKGAQRDFSADTTTLYAVWQINGYSLTVKRTAGGTAKASYGSTPTVITAAEGNGTTSTSNLNYNTKVTLTATPSTGYHLTGWTGTYLSDTDNNASTTLTISNSTNLTTASFNMPNGNTTITANFAVNTYKIKYDPGAGSGTAYVYKESNVEKVYDYGDTTHTIAGKGSFTKDGYTFKGWNKATGQTSAQYTEGQNPTISAIATYCGQTGNLTSTKTLTLYAVWQANTYYVKYNGNGATSGSMSNSTHTYGTASNLTENAYSRAYTVTYHGNNGTVGATGTANTDSTYTFDGWATSAGGDKVYNDKVSVSTLTTTAGATVTIYAHWTGGGVTLPSASRDGYTHAGWATTANGTSVGAAGDTYYPTSTETDDLYALWTANKFSIAYNANGTTAHPASGAPSGATDALEYDKKYTLSDTEPSRTGYTFKGWSTDSGAASGFTAGTELTASQVNTLYGARNTTTNTVTLYATWQIKSYALTAVSENDNKGTASASASSVDYDTSATITATRKRGYTFSNWTFSTEDGFSAPSKYASGSSANTATATFNMPAAKVAATANWTENSYQVNYNKNAASATGTEPTVETKKYTASVTLASNPYTYTGYDFDGWYTLSSGGTKLTDTTVAVSTLVNAQIALADDANNKNVYIYAHWKLHDYTVTVNKGTGISTATGGGTYTMGQTVSVTVSLKNGYKNAVITAKRTDTDAALTLTAITNGKSFTMPASNVTVSTSATAIGYTITFVPNGGSTVGTNNTKSYTTESTDKLPATGKTGYTFQGWVPNAASGNWSTSETYAGGTSGHSLTNMYGDVTLNAQWTINGYSLTVKRTAGGTAKASYGSTELTATEEGATSSSNLDYNTAVSLKATPSTGYHLVNWTGTYNSDTNNGTSTTLTISNSTNLTTATFNMPNGNTTITANFAVNTYKIQYHPGAGSGTAYIYKVNNAEKVYDYGDTTHTIESQPSGFTKTGYTFRGWCKTSGKTAAGDVQYAAGATPKISEMAAYFGKAGNEQTVPVTLTLYAVWTANTYAVKYYSMTGAELTGLAQSGKSYDSEFQLSAAPTVDGWKFYRWATTKGTLPTGTPDQTSTSTTLDCTGGLPAAGFIDTQKVKNLATSGTVSLYAVYKRSVDYHYIDASGAKAVDTIAVGTTGYTNTTNLQYSYVVKDNSTNTDKQYYYTKLKSVTAGPTTEALGGWQVGNWATSDTYVTNATGSGTYANGADYAGFDATSVDFYKMLSRTCNFYYGTDTNSSYTPTQIRNSGSAEANSNNDANETWTVTVSGRPAAVGTNGWSKANGWNTSNSSSAAATYAYSGNATSRTFTEHVGPNFYASYSRTLTVNYNANEPSDASASISGTTHDANNTENKSTKTQYYVTGASMLSSNSIALESNGFSLKGWDASTSWYDALGGTTTVASPTTVGSTSGATGVDSTNSKTVYVHWTAWTFSSQYNLDGGTQGANHPTSWTYDTAKAISPPTKTGYTFQGWKLSGTNANVTTGTDATTAGFRNGTSGEFTTSVKTSTLIRNTDNTTGSDVYVRNLSKTKNAAADTVILTAQWKANTDTKFHVKHYWQDTTGSDYTCHETIEKTGTTATTVTPMSYAKTYTGFDAAIRAYNTDKETTNPTGTETDSSATIAADGSMVISIYYNRTTYALTLTAGTGTENLSSSPATPVRYGATVELTASLKTGYRSLTWSVKNTETTAAVQMATSTTFVMPAYAVTATASATANTFTLHFNGNCGSNTVSNVPGNQTLTYDQAAPTAVGKPTCSGWTFLGWAETSEAHSGAYLTSGDTWTPSSTEVNGWYTTNVVTKDLYAVWSKTVEATFKYYTTSQQTAKKQVTIYNGASLSQTVTAPTTTDTPAIDTYSGWTFDFWTEGTTAAGTQATSFQTGKTYYAIYKRQITLTYVTAYGDTPTADTSKYQKTNANDVNSTGTVTYTLAAKPTTTGRTCSGWVITGATDTSGAVMGEVTITPTDTAVTATAQWSADPFKLTVQSNGHGAVSAKTNDASNTAVTGTNGADVAYATAVELTAGTPTTGYHFNGWTFTGTTPTLTEGTQASNTTIKFDMPAGAVTATANFVKDSWTIKYYKNDNGASVTGSGQDGWETNGIEYGTTYELPNVTDSSLSFSKTGYHFAGWYKETGLTTRIGTAGDTLLIETIAATANVAQGHAITLYAKWEPNQNTAFTVHHMQQELGKSTYTEQSYVNKTGESDSAVTFTDSTILQSYDGFTYDSVNGAGYAYPGAQDANTMKTKPATGATNETTLLANGTLHIYLYYTRNTNEVTISKELPANSGDIGTVQVSYISSNDNQTITRTATTTATGDATNKAYYGDTVTLTATDVAGYTFNGFTVTKEHGGSVTPAGSGNTRTFTMPNDGVTVVASYTRNGYTVTIDMDDALYSQASATFTSGWTKVSDGTGKTKYQRNYDVTTTSIKLPKDVKRVGYTFGGYSVTVTDAAAGTGTNWPSFYSVSAETVTLSGYTGNATLTAQWTVETYTITFYDAKVTDLQGNTISTLDTNIEERLDLSSTHIIATKTGCDFLGWKTQKTGSGKTNFYKNDQQAANVLKWEPLKEYKISEGNMPSGRNTDAGYFYNTDGKTFRLTGMWADRQYRLVYHTNTPEGYTIKDQTGGTYNGNCFDPNGTIATFETTTETEQTNTTMYDEPSSVTTRTQTTLQASPYNSTTGAYLYTTGTNPGTKDSEIRYPIGWSFTPNDTNIGKAFGAKAKLSELMQHAHQNPDAGTDATYTVDVYMVWSANYYELETAAKAFQEKYMTWPANAPTEHGGFYTGAPTQAKLPAGTADSTYQSGGAERNALATRAGTNSDAPTWFKVTASGTAGKYASSTQTPYYAAWQNTNESTIGQIGSTETVGATSTAADRTSDFRTTTVESDHTSVNYVLRQYYANTAPLQAVMAHNGVVFSTQNLTGLYKHEDQATLTAYANALNTAVNTPADNTSFLKDLTLELVDTSATVNTQNDCSSHGTEMDGRLVYNALNNTTTSNSSVLTGLGVSGKYPQCGETTQYRHSYDSLVAKCTAVFKPYETAENSGTYSFTTEKAGSSYTKESVAELYRQLYESTKAVGEETDGGVRGMLYAYNKTSNTYTLKTKLPSMYQYEAAVRKLAAAYHSLVLKPADMSGLDETVENYLNDMWGTSMQVSSRISLGQLEIYFTSTTADRLRNTLNLYQGNATVEGDNGETKFEGGWTVAEQPAVDGKTTGTRTCTSTAKKADGTTPFYNATSSTYNYAEGTLADLLLDLVDALQPKPADYTDVFTIIKTRLEFAGSTFNNAPAMPSLGNLDGDDGWKKNYAKPNVFPSDTDATSPYNAWWMYRYYTPDSVDTLRTYINETLNWNYTAAEQYKINKKSNGQSYDDDTICYALLAAINGLDVRKFQIRVEYGDTGTTTTTPFTIYQYDDGTGAHLDYHYGDTIGTNGNVAQLSYDGHTLTGLFKGNTEIAPALYELVNKNPGGLTLTIPLDDTETGVGSTPGLFERVNNSEVYQLTLVAHWSNSSSTLRVEHGVTDTTGFTLTVTQGSAGAEATKSGSGYAEYARSAGTLLTITASRTGYTLNGWTLTRGTATLPDASTAQNNSVLTPADGQAQTVDYRFGQYDNVTDTLTASWTANTFTVTFDVGTNGSFAANDVFTASNNQKQVTFGGQYGDADGSKTWPQAPTKTVNVEGVSMKAQFVRWTLNGATVAADTRVTVTDSVTLTAEYETAPAESLQTAVTQAMQINANLYTTDSLTNLDNAIKNALQKGTVITDTTDDAIQTAYSQLVPLDGTDGGVPQFDVYETSDAIDEALKGFTQKDKSEINTLRENKGEISYVAAPGTMWYTYMMYTNSETPFILIDAKDIAGETTGKVSYPLTASQAEGTDSLARKQPLNSTGEVMYNQRNASVWWKGQQWYTVDTDGSSGRSAGYTQKTKTITNPYASMKYAGSSYGTAKDSNYSYYSKSDYIILTPTFVKNGKRQYALYTFTVTDDAYNQGAGSATLQGESTLAPSTAAAQSLTSPTNVRPANTISIFVEYCNTMPGAGVQQGQATDANGKGVSEGNYLNVNTDFTPGEKVWKANDWLRRTTGGETLPREYVGWQTLTGGKYGSYVARSPVYGENSIGSFYKVLNKDDANDRAAIDAYWAAIGDKNTQAKRKAASDAAVALLNESIKAQIEAKENPLTSTSKNFNTQQQAVGWGVNGPHGMNDCTGLYAAWPTTTSTQWQTQFYAPATCKEDSLVYVHLYDFFGNHYTGVLQRDWQDTAAPKMSMMSSGHVTVTESGGSGMRQMKITQYSEDGNGEMLPTLGNADGMEFNSATNTFTVTGLGKGSGANEDQFMLYMQDNTGENSQTIPFTAEDGTVTITVVDDVNMRADLLGTQTDDYAAAPMTLVQADEVTQTELKANAIASDMAAAPEETDGDDLYTFILNEVYTVNLFATVDCDIELEATEGGMIKAYLNGEYAPVKAGKIHAQSGQDVQIRAASKAGYELESLVMYYKDGRVIDLMGDYAAELTGDVTIKAVFRTSDTLLTVSVENGHVNGRSEWKVSPYSRVTAAADEAPEGKMFAYWAVNNTPVSYDEVYTFTVTGDTALTAVYSDTAVEQIAAVAMDPASENHLTQVNGAYTLMYSGVITLPEGATLEEFGMILTDKAAEDCDADSLVIGGERTAKLVATQITPQGQYKMTVNNVKPGMTRTGRLYATVTLADGTTTTVYSNTWSELQTPNA